MGQSRLAASWSPKEAQNISDVLFGWTASAPMRGRAGLTWQPGRGWWQWPHAQGPLRPALTNWSRSKEGRLEGRLSEQNSWRNCECLPRSQDDVLKGTVVTLKSLMSGYQGEQRRTAPRTLRFIELKSAQSRAWRGLGHWLGFCFSLKLWKY